MKPLTYLNKRKCCHNEQFWVYWKGGKDVGNDAPIFKRPPWLDTIIVNHKPEDLTHKPLRPFEPSINNCRSCPVNTDLKRYMVKKGYHCKVVARPKY